MRLYQILGIVILLFLVVYGIVIWARVNTDWAQVAYDLGSVFGEVSRGFDETKDLK